MSLFSPSVDRPGRSPVLRTLREIQPQRCRLQIAVISENRVAARPLFEDVDILLGADLLEDLGPHAYGDFAEMRFAQEEHQGAGLADAAANAEGNFILHDALMIGELEEVQLVRQ